MEGETAKGRIGFGGDQWDIPAGARAKGGCCYGDQWAGIRRGFYLAETCRWPGASGFGDEYEARASQQEYTGRSGGDKMDGTVIGNWMQSE